MQDKIAAILNKVVPNAFSSVSSVEIMGTNYLRISIAASDYEINNVSGQYPARVQLSLDVDTLELKPSSWGGMGGQQFYRLPNKENPKERYNALAAVRLPFRKPNANETAVLKAVEKFAQNWKKLLGENLEQMPHRENVDYAKAIA